LIKKAVFNDMLDRDGSCTPIEFKCGLGLNKPMNSQVIHAVLLKKAHIGEVSVTVWSKILKDICSKKNIFVLE